MPGARRAKLPSMHMLHRCRIHAVHFCCRAVLALQSVRRLVHVWQLVWCGLCSLAVYVCQQQNWYLAMEPSLYVGVLVFPLAFAVNAAYQRREGALSRAAKVQGLLPGPVPEPPRVAVRGSVPTDFLECSCASFSALFMYVRGYLTAETEGSKAERLQVECVARVGRAGPPDVSGRDADSP